MLKEYKPFSKNIFTKILHNLFLGASKCRVKNFPRRSLAVPAAVEARGDFGHIQRGLVAETQFDMVFFLDQHQGDLGPFFPAYVVDEIAVVDFELRRDSGGDQPAAAVTLYAAEGFGKINDFTVFQLFI